jgi:hypothetical protein
VIVPNKCVISSETLDTNGQRLAVSLNTLDFEAVGESTNLKLMVQMVSLAGAGMMEGYKSGEGPGSAETEDASGYATFSNFPRHPHSRRRGHALVLASLRFRFHFQGRSLEGQRTSESSC